MFRSKQRPLAIPQSEHQKLAGTLALLWGNAEFELPPVPFDSFVAGVGLHDRAYGPQDNLPIGELPEHEWLALTRAGFDAEWADPIADVIVKMHLRRLTSYGSAPARQPAPHGLDAAIFERIDRITNLCDRIAFDFCFEAPSSGSVRVFPNNNQADPIDLHYQIEDGIIQCDPWPFRVDSHAGYLAGYQLPGYPAKLEPVLLPYQLMRAS